MPLRLRSGFAPRAAVPIRIQTLSEVPDLRENVFRHFITEWPKPGGHDPVTWGNIIDPAVPPNRSGIPLTLVATLDGRYVGQGSLVAHDLDHPLYKDRGPWMGGLCVLPEFRRHGIGQMLHYERLRIAADARIPELFLYTQQRPYPTVSLYERFGWKVECELPDFDDGITIERRFVMVVRPVEIFITG
jgi:GNAT superfamily N-acetyltransferase